MYFFQCFEVSFCELIYKSILSFFLMGVPLASLIKSSVPCLFSSKSFLDSLITSFFRLFDSFLTNLRKSTSDFANISLNFAFSSVLFSITSRILLDTNIIIPNSNTLARFTLFLSLSSRFLRFSICFCSRSCFLFFCRSLRSCSLCSSSLNIYIPPIEKGLKCPLKRF